MGKDFVTEIHFSLIQKNLDVGNLGLLLGVLTDE